MSPSDSDIEARYRDGVASWMRRDLRTAVDTLTDALEASLASAGEPWRGAIERALAQIAMEIDDVDLAAIHLRRFPDDGIGRAQQLALRAQRAHLAGQPVTAAVEVAGALDTLATDDRDDLGSLMNGAIALVWVAEVLVELGLAHDALQAVDEGRRRVTRAGHHDPAIESMQAVHAAEAARLLGDDSRVDAELARVDPTVDVDLPIRVTRLAARRAWSAGDVEEATRQYDDALAACAGIDHVALARLVAAERATGPVGPRGHRLREWVDAELAALASVTPYAVVLTLAVTGDLAPLFALEDAVAALLERRPELGSVDGTGSDGTIWELFLDGEDPAALWSAVRPLVEATDPGAGSHAKVRRGDGVVTIPLA